MNSAPLNDNIKRLVDALNKKSKEIKSDNNTVVLVVCLVASTLFWFLKALNDDYRTELEFPIEFVNIPDNYQLYGEMPEELLVTIQDDGFTIMRYKFSYVFSSLKYDVSKYFEKNQTELSEGVIEITPAALKKSIEGALISNSNFLGVYPESISITYSKYREVKLPIRVVADIKTEVQHIVSDKITTIPDSVTVVGSGQLLAETEAIYTSPIRAHNLDDSLVRMVNLQQVEGLKFREKKVELTIPVESYTEKLVQVPVVARHFPDSLDIRTFPGFATVSCICGLSKYNSIHPSDFQCYIDYSQVQQKSTGQAEVQLVSTNNNVQRAIVKTKLVDYLIEKTLSD